MKTNNHSEIGWHMILGAIVFLMLVPIVFALSNSFKTLQDAFNTIFEIIPSHPTLENYRHVFEKLPFVQITLNTFLIAASVTAFKTITSLLPFFVISGVVTAGMTTDDPYWYHNNFSQLGDRTTFAARMFNSTLILAGTCIIIVSYFAISELVTTERLQRLWHDRTNRDPNRGYEIPHFMLRISILSFLLMVAGLAFIGIGVFRYTPHNLLHNICAKGLPFVMLLLFVLLPWLAPRLSKAVMVSSDLTALVCAAFWVNMMMGHNTLTNVEALAGLAFLGWFIVFSRQIAAIEADRAAAQLLHAQAIEGGFEQPSSAPDQQIESRIAADR